ncbi:MAG: sigma-54 dependent transcriptional regulator [bacterium]|nr:sigma-54 dependent transcriptional regulator [Candidatus Margulisiibacteriota bacterium]
MSNILVIDDEPSIRESFSLVLEGKYKVITAASGEAGLKAASAQKINLVFLDFRMPGMNGLETLKRLKEIDSSLEVIMVTAVNEVEKASEAVKLGAHDYIVKPFDVDHLLNITEQTLRRKSLVAEGLAAQKKASQKNAVLVGQAEAIVKIVETVKTIKDEQKVLIIGEAGTEKELIAKTIHEQSGRAKEPFKIFSISPSLTKNQIINALFGWERGSTTADFKSKTGLFEEAAAGTLVINNAAALPQEAQAAIKLGKFSRQGQTNDEIKLEARLIFLEESDSKKNQAEIKLELPPLRERYLDLPLLIENFLEKFNHHYGEKVTFDKKTIELLANYSWPGNTIELEGLIERLVLLTKPASNIIKSLPLEILLANGSEAGADILANFEKEYLRKIYSMLGKNKQKTAEFLGVTPMLLDAKL